MSTPEEGSTSLSNINTDQVNSDEAIRDRQEDEEDQ